MGIHISSKVIQVGLKRGNIGETITGTCFSSFDITPLALLVKITLIQHCKSVKGD